MPPKAKAKPKPKSQPLNASLLNKIKSKVALLNELSPKPTSKEHQMSFGILKSSDDMPEPPKKEKKKKHKDKEK